MSHFKSLRLNIARMRDCHGRMNDAAKAVRDGVMAVHPEEITPALFATMRQDIDQWHRYSQGYTELMNQTIEDLIEILEDLEKQAGEENAQKLD